MGGGRNCVVLFLFFWFGHDNVGGRAVEVRFGDDQQGYMHVYHVYLSSFAWFACSRTHTRPVGSTAAGYTIGVVYHTSSIR